MSNQHDEKKNIYGKAMESFLFHQSKEHESKNTEENKWLSVQNAELKYQNQKRHGKWPVVQIKLENVCN
jgi:hypothetical protein